MCMCVAKFKEEGGDRNPGTTVWTLALTTEMLAQASFLVKLRSKFHALCFYFTCRYSFKNFFLSGFCPHHWNFLITFSDLHVVKWFVLHPQFSCSLKRRWHWWNISSSFEMLSSLGFIKGNLPDTLASETQSVLVISLVYLLFVDSWLSLLVPVDFLPASCCCVPSLNPWIYFLYYFLGGFI